MTMPRTTTLALILLAFVTLLVPAGWLLAPHVHRWRTISQLNSTDDAARQRAFGAITQHARDDERLRTDALAQLKHLDDPAFLDLQSALDLAGLWSRDVVPPDAWLRWLTLMAGDASTSARIAAAQQLANLPDYAGDPRVHRALALLLTDADAAVRHHALITAIVLTHAANSNAHERLIVARTADPHPAIARRAWIALGLINPTSGVRANWRSAPPEVAIALLWASLQTNPAAPGPAIEALDAPQADPSTRAAAAYALAQSDTPEAAAALQQIIEQADLATLNAPALVRLWRAVLAVPLNDTSRETLAALAARIRTLPPPAQEDLAPVLAAAYHRVPSLALLRSDSPPAILRLAAVEASLGADLRWPIEPSDPILLQLIATAASPDADLAAARAALLSDDAALRDVACVLLAEHVAADRLAPLISDLLIADDNRARMSGALLVGLTGQHLDLLRKQTAAEDDWAVQTMMRLALYMQGQLPEVEHEIPALLARNDLPRETILLALLHRDPPRALRRLFPLDPQVPSDLLPLLDQRRWWHVLQQYLPDDAPPLWLWADTQLQDFQLEVLHTWLLLHHSDHIAEAHSQTPTPAQRSVE